MEKIKMTTPLVEMDGDEMAAILWKETREKLVPFRGPDGGLLRLKHPQP